VRLTAPTLSATAEGVRQLGEIRAATFAGESLRAFNFDANPHVDPASR
jgi:hypothetical protein